MKNDTVHELDKFHTFENNIVKGSCFWASEQKLLIIFYKLIIKFFLSFFDIKQVKTLFTFCIKEMLQETIFRANTKTRSKIKARKKIIESAKQKSNSM